MNFKNIILALSILSATSAFCEQSIDDPTITEVTFAESIVEQNTSQILEEKSPLDIQKTNQLLVEKERLDKELIENNIWSKIYSNFHTYQVLKKQQITLEATIDRLENIIKRTRTENEELESAQDKKVTLLGKLQLLKEYEKDPFEKFLTPPAIGTVPSVENPFAVIGAISYREKLQSDMDEYNSRYDSLEHIVGKFKEKQSILKKLLKLDSLNVELY